MGDCSFCKQILFSPIIISSINVKPSHCCFSWVRLLHEMLLICSTESWASWYSTCFFRFFLFFVSKNNPKFYITFPQSIPPWRNENYTVYSKLNTGIWRNTSNKRAQIFSELEYDSRYLDLINNRDIWKFMQV